MSPSRQAEGASRKDVRKNTRLWNFATEANEFEEVSKYLQNGSGASIQADKRPLCPFNQFHFVRTFFGINNDLKKKKGPRGNGREGRGHLTPLPVKNAVQ